METEVSRAMQFFAVMDRMRRVWKGVTPCNGINKSQLGTLLVLSHGGLMPFQNTESNRNPQEPMTLSAISAAMGQSLPAVSQRISHLEEMGYVERFSDQKDKRTVWIRLSDQGIQLLQEARDNIVYKLDLIMDTLGDEKMDTVFELLGQLADTMEKVLLKEAELPSEHTQSSIQ